MSKKPTLYIAIICVWAVGLVLLALSTARIIFLLDGFTTLNKTLIIIALIINSIVLGILWLGSVKDFLFSLTHALFKGRMKKAYEVVDSFQYIPLPAPKFLLLYCTCNDFNSQAISLSIAQDYSNFKVVILDDSTQEKYIKEIDEYVLSHPNIEIVRREERVGYKAGNLNNYLSGRTDYDYFVVLDSDEIIPSNYIQSVIKYFNYNSKCGAVQARHIADKGGNIFQRLMSMSVESNGASVQIVKNFYGANALIGHGMTISKECYILTGGFPQVVAEDISFAVDIKNAGLDIIYAPDIVCTEQFPINYVSLKKRQCKWTQGNLEYMKKYDSEINSSKMSWFEKFDIKLSHYSLPIVPILSFLLALCTIFMGFLGYPIIRYSLIIHIIMIVFLCSPMIPDLFVHKANKNIFLLVPYFLVNVITYASLAPMMISTVIKGLFGKRAVFLVTPKDDEKFSLLEIIRYSIDSIIFALVFAALSLIACKSILPLIILTFSCLLSPVIIALSNITIKRKV